MKFEGQEPEIPVSLQEKIKIFNAGVEKFVDEDHFIKLADLVTKLVVQIEELEEKNRELKRQLDEKMKVKA